MPPAATSATSSSTSVPVGWWARLELTAGQRPRLRPAESELLVQNNVGLYQDKRKAPLFPSGRVYLTSKRICYVDSACPSERSIELALTDIKGIEYYGGFMRSSPKITLRMGRADENTSTRTSNSSSSTANPSSAPSPSSSSISLPLSLPPVTRRRKLPFHEVSWYCPICFFANSLPRDFEWPSQEPLPNDIAGLSDPEGTTGMPPCSTCGIKATRKVIFQAIAQIMGPTSSGADTPAPVPSKPAPAKPPQPPPSSSSSGIPDLMMMVTDDDTNRSALIPTMADAAASTESAPNGDSDEDGFPCPRCTFINHPSLNFCEICGARLVSAHIPPQLNRVLVQDQSTLPSTQMAAARRPFQSSSNRTTSAVLQYDDDGYLVSLLGTDALPDSFAEQQQQVGQPLAYKLSFRSGGDKQFYDALKQQLAKIQATKLQESSERLASSSAVSSTQVLSGNTSSGSAPQDSDKLAVGIHGLQLSVESRREHNRQVLGAGLEDLNELMARAKDLIKLADDYARFLEHAPASSSESLAAAQEARRSLAYSTQALGLSSTVVTKDMVASEDSKLYYAELARQIAEFLMDNKHWHASTSDLYEGSTAGGAGANHGPESHSIQSQSKQQQQQHYASVLEREGGIITLFDLFAVYNRARGVALISPKDLASACDLFAELALPVRLRSFRSGLTVVQEAYKTPEVVMRSLRRWMVQRGEETRKNSNGSEEYLGFEGSGVTAVDVSAKFRWSVMIAAEELELAEENGELCRDEQVSGTIFYENLFESFKWDPKDVFQNNEI